MNELIQTVAVYALPVLFAITLHEAAHAYAAKFFGDTTAYSMGRMSLNPLKHIDPFGTIVIPLLLYFATSGAFLFGYARPVPINFGHLRKPKRDMAWVSLAGPAANFFMALLWLLAIYGLALAGVQEEFFTLMAKAGVQTNLVMFAFNLFPIPPLDGGRILTSLLPNRYAYKFAQIEPYGFFIVMALVLLKVIYAWWMAPVMFVAGKLLQLITFPITLLF
ncbi:Zn-dependent protease [Herbaspirillum sp. GW103]|jgi:Zn-dependent protease|uniref:site-2 protease family protein n=1 Tax=unclassified Herbaspirillum TaxID=2624150 RepID=UPI00025E45C0|nr:MULTISPECIES: site-2 protease family protein [unclassified Herbaspirillum]EIJ45638.1 Zn-dependent protease [Herbaspirillum sp. GW103]MCI1006229.1 site-2 protease family protein [Herbaspirillum sp. C7C8]NUT61191.1 site-2 protease family protein [Herbaspirillum sp. C9C3]